MEFDCAGRRCYLADGRGGFAADRPSIVLLHGAGMDHTPWLWLARNCASHGFNVLAFDLPGHGRSAGPPLATVEELADWLAAALTTLTVDRAVVAGHSLGALVALEFARRQPARVERLVLLGCAWPMRVGEALLEAAAANDPAAIDMMAIWAHDYRSRMGANRVAGVSVVNSMMRLLERAAPGVLHTDLHACHVYEGGAAAAAVACPVRFICGEQDRMTPLRASAEFARALPDATLARIADCGHIMMSERPEATARKLMAALAGATVS